MSQELVSVVLVMSSYWVKLRRAWSRFPKTINGAANLAKPGTDVVVRGGTYNGSVYIPLSGTYSLSIEWHPDNSPLE
jgi:hypothetical protein